jgi:hypothetical protein
LPTHAAHSLAFNADSNRRASDRVVGPVTVTCVVWLVPPTEEPLLWRFSSSLRADRVDRLLSHDSFSAVADLVEASSILAFCWEPFLADRLKGCHRASFLLQASTEAYDAFFNSPVGYRAQFARSVEEGERANRMLLERLRGNLIEFGSPQMPVSPEHLKLSLDATDAKIWILESEVELHLGDDTPEISYKPWEQAAPRGVGLRAPLGTHLEIKGGWLDARGNECRDPYKATRSDDIRESGYS